jgi:hypothetical protein
MCEARLGGGQLSPSRRLRRGVREHKRVSSSSLEFKGLSSPPPKRASEFKALPTTHQKYSPQLLATLLSRPPPGRFTPWETAR